MAGKKREIKALKRRVAELEAEVATLRTRPHITWTLPGMPPALPDPQRWQPPWICGDSSTRGEVKVIRSGGSLHTSAGQTFTWN
jgi:hypothetical protein